MSEPGRRHYSILDSVPQEFKGLKQEKSEQRSTASSDPKCLTTTPADPRLSHLANKPQWRVRPCAAPCGAATTCFAERVYFHTGGKAPEQDITDSYRCPHIRQILQLPRDNQSIKVQLWAVAHAHTRRFHPPCSVNKWFSFMHANHVFTFYVASQFGLPMAHNHHRATHRHKLQQDIEHGHTWPTRPCKDSHGHHGHGSYLQPVMTELSYPTHSS